MRFISQAAGLMALAAIISAPATATAWEPKQARLMTDWARQVDPANPLPEYPRPQMVRGEWLNLNGVWEFQAGAAGEVVPGNQKLAEEILVPFPMESALSGVMKYHERSWYRRTFTVPEKWLGRRIVLHLDAVDWESEIFINGKSAGVHKGGYDPASYDITAYLNGRSPQELIVRVYDPTDAAGEPRGKQTLHPGGIMYTSTSGIWQPVWLEPVPATGIADLKLVPDIDAGGLKLSVTVSGTADDMKVNAIARVGKKVIGKISGAPGAELFLSVPKATLWCPTNPFLYDLDVTLTKGGKNLDAVTSYFGMRKISLGKVDGFVKILLNNQFVFQFGPLDQGFWPDGIYTAPTDDALKSDIQREKAVGFNMVRKHIKVERARFSSGRTCRASIPIPTIPQFPTRRSSKLN
jgi:beta-galactosidase/beta-glucuronidase